MPAALASRSLKPSSVVDFQLHQAQADFLDSQAVFRGFVGGRGVGKSWVGAYDLLRRAKPDRLYIVTAPTYGMLEDSTHRSFNAIAERLGCVRNVNKSRMQVTLGNGAEVLFRSTDDPEKLRGPNASGCWMDEASQTAREAFDIVIGCLREEGEQGWLSATFTPKGKSHWTYDVFGKGREGAVLFHARTSENPFLPESFYETVKHQYSPLRTLQELEGEFVDLEGAEWPGEWFGPSIWFDEWPPDIQCRVVALDPSKGKDAKFGDYSAFVKLAVTGDGSMYVDCDMARRDTSRIAETACEINHAFRPDAFVVETNGFQESIAQDFIRLEKETGSFPPPVVGFNNMKPSKVVRILRLTPYLARGVIRFKGASPGAELLVQQLRDFPQGEHDDGPDALEMAVRAARELLGEREVQPEFSYATT